MHAIWRTLVVVMLLACPTRQVRSNWSDLVEYPTPNMGSWSCASTACHGGEPRGAGSGSSIGGELEIWRNADPHARASSVIESQAFTRILAKLRIAKAESLDSKPVGPGSRQHLVRDQIRLEECMNCHNPGGMPTSWRREELVVNSDDGPLSDGLAISCETCHGSAKQWIASHYRRDFDRTAAGRRQGFHDLKDLVVRGRTCAQCHIGDGQRDMNHDMIAAGHPPLRFELASYERALPKHWNDRRARTFTRDYELKLWLAGQIANFDSGLSLTESRLRRAESGEDTGRAAHSEHRAIAPWPEFAEYRCSSCHQALRSPTEIGLELESRDEPLVWSGWNHGLIDALTSESPNAAALASLRKQLNGSHRLDEVSQRNLANEIRDLRQQPGGFRHSVAEVYPELFDWPAGLRRPLAARLQSLTLPAQDYDHHLQSYAFVAAQAKAAADESVKSGEPPVEAQQALRQLRSATPWLVPRGAADASPNRRPPSTGIGKAITAAADGLRQPNRDSR